MANPETFQAEDRRGGRVSAVKEVMWFIAVALTITCELHYLGAF